MWGKFNGGVKIMIAIIDAVNYNKLRHKKQNKGKL
jgi:hypothetical protein